MNTNLQLVAEAVSKALQPKGISSRVAQKDSTLQIFLQSAQPIAKGSVTTFLANGIKKLNLDGITNLAVYAKLVGQSEVAWSSHVELLPMREGFPDPTKPQITQISTKNAANYPNTAIAYKPLDTGKSLINVAKLQVIHSKLQPVIERCMSFVSTRNGERISLVAGTFILTSIFWMVAGKISQQHPPGLDFSNTNSSTGRIVEKPLPELGSAATQQRFQVDDALAVLNGTPRPTYPSTLAVLAGNPPPGIDVCNLPYSAITSAIYAQCIKEGMDYIQVSNIIGFAGENTSESGSSRTYRWGDGDGGEMIATFENNKLVSKSQTRLK